MRNEPAVKREILRKTEQQLKDAEWVERYAPTAPPLKKRAPIQRFFLAVGCIAAAIEEAFPDFVQEMVGVYKIRFTNGAYIFDLQEVDAAVIFSGRYAQMICLETIDDGQCNYPFSRMEEWMNALDNVALESEGLPPTEQGKLLANWSRLNKSFTKINGGPLES